MTARLFIFKEDDFHAHAVFSPGPEAHTVHLIFNKSPDYAHPPEFAVWSHEVAALTQAGGLPTVLHVVHPGQHAVHLLLPVAE